MDAVVVVVVVVKEIGDEQSVRPSFELANCSTALFEDDRYLGISSPVNNRRSGSRGQQVVLVFEQVDDLRERDGRRMSVYERGQTLQRASDATESQFLSF